MGESNRADAPRPAPPDRARGAGDRPVPDRAAGADGLRQRARARRERRRGLGHASRAEPYVSFLFERDLDDSLVLNTDYLQIFLRSFWLSAATTALCLLRGLPDGALHGAPARAAPQPPDLPRHDPVLDQPAGPQLRLDPAPAEQRAGRRRCSGALGLTDAPIGVLYTPFAIMVGLTYTFLPFMVLPIYASLEKLDLRLVEAAFDLGADRRRALTPGGRAAGDARDRRRLHPGLRAQPRRLRDARAARRLASR